MLLDFQDTEIAFASKSSGELRHSYWIFKLLNSPDLVSVGSGLAKVALGLHLPIAPLIRASIFRQFCGGETLEESFTKAKALSKQGVGTILDVAVEGSQNEKVFEETAAEILKTIDLAETHAFLPFSVFKITGIANFSLLEKIQKKEELSAEEEKQWVAVRGRVNRICQRAFERNVPLLVDAEESWIQGTIDALANDMMEKYNQSTPIIYNTIQLYRKDRLKFLEKCLSEAKKKSYTLAVKIVRGAYLEKERNRAAEEKRASPLFDTKEQTDEAYDKAIDFCLENLESMALVAGTHNEESTHHLIDEMKRRGISKDDARIYFSQLYGMSDHLSFHLAKAGYHVAKYLPYGEVRVLMPYLIRRAQENTAIHGQTPRELSLIEKELRRRKG